jgi:hypothetical protein
MLDIAKTNFLPDRLNDPVRKQHISESAITRDTVHKMKTKRRIGEGLPVHYLHKMSHDRETSDGRVALVKTE